VLPPFNFANVEYAEELTLFIVVAALAEYAEALAKAPDAL
jgi:hypothetical protein